MREDEIVEICDYQEDSVINGVLHYFYDGKWTEYSKKALTEMILLEQSSFDSYIDRHA